MAENLLITRMTSDDIDDVVLLDRSIFYDPWARTSFSGSLKKDTCLVLRRDGELEGYYPAPNGREDAITMHAYRKK